MNPRGEMCALDSIRTSNSLDIKAAAAAARERSAWQGCFIAFPFKALSQIAPFHDDSNHITGKWWQKLRQREQGNARCWSDCLIEAQSAFLRISACSGGYSMVGFYTFTVTRISKSPPAVNSKLLIKSDNCGLFLDASAFFFAIHLRFTQHDRFDDN